MYDSRACDARVHHFCHSNWRQAGYLTLGGVCLAIGLFIAVLGIRESLSTDIRNGGLGHLWPFGPIFILIGIVIVVAALLMRKRAVDLEEGNRENGDIHILEREEPPEKQAVFFEPILIL